MAGVLSERCRCWCCWSAWPSSFPGGRGGCAGPSSASCCRPDRRRHVILPPIRYRVFWYAISPTEIDIQHGIIFIKRSVVPMHRVQNLRTERGPMADHYRMTNLKIKTAAGSVTISGLDRAEANELCERISRLADVADDV